MKTVVIVQARMTSTRLPGKVLLPLAGRPMLQRLLERLARAHRVDQLVVATTTNIADEVIVDLCREQGVAYFRGSEQDVLSRYAGAARIHHAELVVRITSDCPLLDPELVDRVIEYYGAHAGRCDYVSNMLEPTFPYGMAVEAFPASVLWAADAEASEDAEREHVTPFIYWRPDRFRLCSYSLGMDLTRHRWTVDTPDDYQLVKQIFEALFPEKPEFAMADVLQLLKTKPAWSRINSHVTQRAVIRRS